MSKSKLLRLLWDIVVLRLVAFLLNMRSVEIYNFYTKFDIHKFWYKFDTVLFQFYQLLETRTSDRTLIGLDQLLKCVCFSLYPISFFFYSPF